MMQHPTISRPRPALWTSLRGCVSIALLMAAGSYCVSVRAEPGDRAILQLAEQSPDPRELIRKGVAGEQEDGFCATLDWPVRQTPDAFFGFLSNGEAGSVYYARSKYSTGGGCSHYRILSVSNDGRKCADTIAWACFDGGQCNQVRRTWCQNTDGSWSYQR